MCRLNLSLLHFVEVLEGVCGASESYIRTALGREGPEAKILELKVRRDQVAEAYPRVSLVCGGACESEHWVVILRRQSLG